MKTKVPFMQNFENKNLSLERFFIGLTIALAGTLAAFEWRTTYNVSSLPPGIPVEENIFIEEPPICIIRKIKEKIEPSKPKNSTASIKVSKKIEIVDNAVKIEDKQEFPAVVEIKPVDFTDEPFPAEWDIFTPVEQMPQFPGGELELMKFLKKNVKYPKMSKELGITGMVFVEFIVDVDGTMNNIKIAKGVSSDIDKEAIRIVSMMPKWVPGSQRNKPIQVGMRLPIRFTLM